MFVAGHCVCVEVGVCLLYLAIVTNTVLALATFGQLRVHWPDVSSQWDAHSGGVFGSLAPLVAAKERTLLGAIKPDADGPAQVRTRVPARHWNEALVLLWPLSRAV